MLTTRRSFLTTAASPIALSVASVISQHTTRAAQQLSKSDIAEFRNDLLKLVNTERVAAGLSSLAIDELACAVSDQHALDMATRRFLSHWGSDGRKPYQRYSSAGGFQAVQENVSAADDLESASPKYIGWTLSQMHLKMYAEVPPNDGHRRTILTPEHTHAGFGIALDGLFLRLAELYVARHVLLQPFDRRVDRKARPQISGELLDRRWKLVYAEIFFEPPPAPPELSWLRVARPYGLPPEYKIIRPVAPQGQFYTDGSSGDIKISERGKFTIPLKFDKSKPGIYTVVIWISDLEGKRKSAATYACIQVD